MGPTIAWQGWPLFAVFMTLFVAGTLLLPPGRSLLLFRLALPFYPQS